ncbi:MAG: hypothetical protein M1462_01160 [Candidatus Thermoplasmatota archaeon]|jgi:dihydrodipicolinate synthase/N-acetylneuraminate lyase|nr:hypothetical protein [Candidatus Thermoplasmatota archaeon]
MKKITGIIPAIPTIFKENAEIDFDGLIECINFAVKSGAKDAYLIKVKVKTVPG